MVIHPQFVVAYVYQSFDHSDPKAFVLPVISMYDATVLYEVTTSIINGLLYSCSPAAYGTATATVFILKNSNISHSV